MKAIVGTLNQEKALVGAVSVITNLRMELFEAEGQNVNIINYVVLKAVLNSEVKNSLNCDRVFFYNLADRNGKPGKLCQLFPLLKVMRLG